MECEQYKWYYKNAASSGYDVDTIADVTEQVKSTGISFKVDLCAFIKNSLLYVQTIYFLSSASNAGPTELSLKGTRVKVSYSGQVLAPLVMRLQTTCTVNLRKFPFDKQECTIIINVAEELTYMTLTPGSNEGIATVDLFDVNNEWKNVNFTVFYVHTEIEQVDTQDKMDIVIKMERNPTFYVIYLLIPSVLMGFVSVLVFLLPPESGERVGLSITVLLSYSVFLLMVSEVTPRGGSNTSLLGILSYTLSLSNLFHIPDV